VSASLVLPVLPVLVPLALAAALPLSSPLELPVLELVLASPPELLAVVDVSGCGPLVNPDDAAGP